MRQLPVRVTIHVQTDGKRQAVALRNRRRHRFRGWACVGRGHSAHAAEDQNPLAGDPQAAKAGEYQFRINCALCHGLGAHGGGRGPDLTRAEKKHTHSDADMFQVISNGIAGTAMPANGTNGQGVGMTDEEIWQIITYIRSQEVKAPAHAAGQCWRMAKNCSTATRIARCVTWSRAKADRLGPELTSGGRIAHA